MKTKKKKVVVPLKAIITSPYQLSSQEVEDLKTKFPIMNNLETENIVDKDLYAGVVIRVGTKRIDLSLSRGLQNLKQFIYEHR